MKSENCSTRTFRFGLAAIVVSTALALGSTSPARAQDATSADAAASAPANQPDQNAAIDPEQKAKADAAQQAHDAADAAQEQLESATETRDQLESDGASQDQIDAANAAIAQARANKDAADATAQSADEAANQ